MISYFTKIFQKVTFFRYLNLVMKLFISEKSLYHHIYIINHAIISLTHTAYIFEIKCMHRAQNVITTNLFTFSWAKLSNVEYSNAICRTLIMSLNCNSCAVYWLLAWASNVKGYGSNRLGKIFFSLKYR